MLNMIKEPMFTQEIGCTAYGCYWNFLADELFDKFFYLRTTKSENESMPAITIMAVIMRGIRFLNYV